MIKVSTMPFSRLKNAEHVSLFTNVKVAIDKVGVTALGLAADLYATYVQALATEQDIVNRALGSVYTPEMKALDDERDRLFRLIRLKLQGCLLASPTSEVTQYATTIDKYLLSRYVSDVTQLAYQEESAVIAGFILDVNKYLGEEGVEACSIVDELFELEKANNSFAEQYHDRVSEKAGTDPEKTLKLRSETEELYHLITLHVEYQANAKTASSAGETCIALIAHIDQLISDAQTRLNARLGKGSSSDGSSDSDNVSPIPFPNK